MKNLDKKDIIKIITMIRINFDNSYRLTDEEFPILVDSWYSILAPYPREIVYEAVKRTLAHAEFVPRIGNIVTEIERMVDACRENETTLWSRLCKHLVEVERCRNMLPCTYCDDGESSQGEKAWKRINEIYDGLPEEVREYLGSVGQLIALANSNEEGLSIERGRFLKSIPTIRRRAYDRKTLSPAAVRLLSDGIPLLPPPEEDDE